MVVDFDLAQRLFVHEPRLSRNKHFAAFRHPRFRGALQLDRRLRALHAAIVRAQQGGGRVVVEHGLAGGHPAVRVIIEDARARHLSLLSAAEWSVFLAHDGVRACLAALGIR